MSAESLPVILPLPNTGEVRRIALAYIDYLRLRMRLGKISPRTFDKPLHYVNRFSADYGAYAVAELHKNTLEKWLNAHPEWQAPSTVLDAVNSVMGMMTWAVNEEEIIPRNPMKRPKGMATPGPRIPLFKEEWKALGRAARDFNGKRKRRRPTSAMFRLAIWALWWTGCRPGEMLEAEWDDFDLRTGAIRLFEHKTARKTGQCRILALDRWLLYMIGRLRPALLVAGQKIFPSLRGGRWNEFDKAFRRYANAAGIDKEKSAYCLRHGVCVDLLEHGASDRQAADFLGHTSTRYVSWYGRATRTKIDHLRRIQALRRHRLDHD